MVVTSPRALARLLFACGMAAASGSATAGSFDVFGIPVENKVTIGYAVAQRMEDADPALIQGPIDVQQVQLSNPLDPCAAPPCIGSFGHTGLPIQTNFDDGNRDFEKGDYTNNRLSIYSEWQFKFDNFGIGDVGAVVSGAAHYDKAFLKRNRHDNPESVNRMRVVDTDPPNGRYERVGPVNEWTPEAESTNGRRARLLEAYAYGQWYLTDTIGLSLRAGKHLAAWGESLFFPGIVSAQGPFDATKANVPGVEIKEILLPVNQVSMQMSLTDDLTVMAYNQFEFDETEVYPQGDFFSPADLIGPGASFGYGSINPLHEDWCNNSERVEVRSFDGTPAPDGSLCTAADVALTPGSAPKYIYTVRTADDRPDSDAERKQYGIGVKYQLASNFNLGGYYLRYNNHNPNVGLNMGYAYVGDAQSTGQPVTTQAFNIRVPTSYTVGYADNVEMRALSFSTVFWVFNIAGEVIQRLNVDTSLEADIAGVIAPVGTRGDTLTAQTSFLYVNNPDFLMFDEVVVVGELGWTTVTDVDPRRNEDGICYTGAEANDDCARGKPDNQYVNYGDELFYDKSASAIQMLILPKGRNVFPGWDISTPINFAWLIDGTPSTPGVFGALYGEGDMRASLGVTGQFLQNFELSLSYNAFLGDAEKNIRNSQLRANPYVDRDYLALSAKYNL
jgi:hypothetical protein